MKDRLITEIQTAMAPLLNQDQLAELGGVLLNSFSRVEITMLNDSGSRIHTGNSQLLEIFMAAKHIEGCSARSLDYYRVTIGRMFEAVGKPVRGINTDDLRCYLMQYQQRRNSSKVTIDNVRRIFSSFFGWLEDEDYILKSPVRRIRRIKADKTIKDTFTDEGLERLRDTCAEIRDLAIVDLLASTGMRVGELVKLTRRDINFHERECVVFGKGNSERVVYFDARTKIHLLNYLETRADDNPALFVSLGRQREPLRIGGVEARLRSLGRKASLSQKVHPHKFRRTLATRAIDKGMPIEQVQRLLGHVKIDTTMHYAMVNQVNVKHSHRKFIG
ncbi:MAG: tyrosine-type recombinase/integrase [Desulfovibrionaceae bacterium]|nr:tyrosine-type recombinase/integrase [Desulfovibrionaceae bacterium]